MIPYTQARHTALRNVFDREVDFWSGYTSHVQGYGWHDGGDMPQSEQDALRDLAAHHLIAAIPCHVRGEIACEVTLTRRGSQQLSDWDTRQGVSS